MQMAVIKIRFDRKTGKKIDEVLEKLKDCNDDYEDQVLDILIEKLDNSILNEEYRSKGTKELTI